MRPFAWLFGNGAALRAGDWVEVRSAEDILGTLDAAGRLAALPFMPEMLAFCGRRFRVGKSAHKTCDTIKTFKARRLQDAVHLEGLRCDGAGHGGCQAGCLLFWKTDWLRRVPGPAGGAAGGAPAAGAAADGKAVPPALARGALQSAGAAPGQERYACQATELVRATLPLRWWDPRQYLQDLGSGNVGLGTFIRYAALAARNALIRRRRRDPGYPQVPGLAQGKVAADPLHLQPGETVQVRSREEILRTLGHNRKHRGLWFDIEMEAFCGSTHKVLRRVDRIINEGTGEMISIPGDCIVLDHVACGGCLSRDRMFCPRAVYPYWREVWLRRVSPAGA